MGLLHPPWPHLLAPVLKYMSGLLTFTLVCRGKTLPCLESRQCSASERQGTAGDIRDEDNQRLLQGIPWAGEVQLSAVHQVCRSTGMPSTHAGYQYNSPSNSLTLGLRLIIPTPHIRVALHSANAGSCLHFDSRDLGSMTASCHVYDAPWFIPYVVSQGMGRCPLYVL